MKTIQTFPPTGFGHHRRGELVILSESQAAQATVRLRGIETVRAWEALWQAESAGAGVKRRGYKGSPGGGEVGTIPDEAARRRLQRRFNVCAAHYEVARDLLGGKEVPDAVLDAAEDLGEALMRPPGASGEEDLAALQDHLSILKRATETVVSERVRSAVPA